ncbi:hypothetical protein EMCRGX_G031398 [Ephydatia muelleri]
MTDFSPTSTPTDRLAAVKIEGIKGEVTMMSKAACFPLSQLRASTVHPLARYGLGTMMFLHWLAGMIFIFYFASFVILLREVLRPGVLWFLRNLNDQNFHPIQEVIFDFTPAPGFLLIVPVATDAHICVNMADDWSAFPEAFPEVSDVMRDVWYKCCCNCANSTKIVGYLPGFLPYNLTLTSVCWSSPAGVGWSGFAYTTCLVSYRYFYPVLMLAAFSLCAIVFCIQQCRKLYNHIKNEKYLVGQQLVNYGNEMVGDAQLSTPIQESRER